MRNLVSVALVLLVLLGAGCRHRAPSPSPPSNFVILLRNDEGGSSGSLVVTNAAGSQELAEAYSVVTVSGANDAPRAPAKLDPAEVQRLFGDTLALIPAAEARFNLYFESGGTMLTAESAAELPKIIEAYRQRHSTDVTIIGHTDTVGENQANYELGLQRAQQVSKDIQSGGVDAEHIFLESHGETDLLVATPNNVEEPRNRRVEVIVR